jgi:hypothetical protein
MELEWWLWNAHSSVVEVVTISCMHLQLLSCNTEYLHYHNNNDDDADFL